MQEGKAMQNHAGAAVVALAGLRLPLRPLPARADGEALVLTRNAAVAEPLGGRTWRGVLGNTAGRTCMEVAVRIDFLDRAGRPVGAPLSARVARLAPGAGLDLQARLPAGAVGLRLAALRWTGGGEPVRRGPGPSCRFGVDPG